MKLEGFLTLEISDTLLLFHEKVRLIKIVIVSILSLQLIISPGLSYLFFGEGNLELKGFDFFMRVDPEVYFLNTLPAVIFFALGIFIKLGMSKRLLSNYDKLKIEPHTCITFFLVVTFMHVLNWSGILFVGNLLYSILISITAVLLMYLSFSKFFYSKVLIVITYLYLLIQSSKTGMFGQLFFIVALNFILVFDLKSIKWWKGILLASFFLYFFIVLQNTKQEFRNNMNKGSLNLSSFVASFGKSMTLNSIQSTDQVYLGLFSLNIRLNQGFFLSHVYDHVPQHEGFTYGSNILEGVSGSFVPRFLWQDKPMSGGKAELKKYAGMELDGDTSANISLVGDAYVVFGFWFTPVIMFFLGLILNYFYYRFLRLTSTYKNLFFWHPLFILPTFQSIEENIMSLTNTYVKMAIILFMIFLIFPKKLFR